MGLENIRSQFPTLKKDNVYLDSSSSALTPYSVIKSISEYYEKYSTNSQRGEYNLSLKLDKKIESVRQKIAGFINASSPKEIVFTPGTTYSSNLVSRMILSKLDPHDEVVLTHHAHSSLFAPILALQKRKEFLVNFLPLNDDLTLDLEKFVEKVNIKTKVVFITHVTNLYGIEMPLKEIKRLMKLHCPNAIFIVDAAQSAPHTKIDVQDIECDFLFFSGHKVFGPTGIGVLWGKESLLNVFEPPFLGGGQILNVRLSENNLIELKSVPHKFEAGTLPLSGILGLGTAIDFVQGIGILNIQRHILSLRSYLFDLLKEVNHIEILSKRELGVNFVFNVKGYEVHDVVTHLDAHGISVRGGQHCAQLLSEHKSHLRNTIRVSFQIYNNAKDIERLVYILKERKNSFLDGFVK